MTESVVLVPVDAGPLVQELRLQYDPSAKAGIPAHITLMFPFLPTDELAEDRISALEALIGEFDRFEFSLTRVHEFAQGVVYLDPEPATPFIQLTKKITEMFGMLPFGGEFGTTPVPHLTLTTPESGMTRVQIATQVEPLLPIRIVADTAWLLIGENSTTWTIVREMRFG
jgi:2'-5' RNA ligase